MEQPRSQTGELLPEPLPYRPPVANGSQLCRLSREVNVERREYRHQRGLVAGILDVDEDGPVGQARTCAGGF
jgi:hypothetical protein